MPMLERRLAHGIERQAGREGCSAKTPAERIEVRGQFCMMFSPTIPVDVDDVSDPVRTAYRGMPGSMYVIDPKGIVAYQRGRGPFGFRAGEMEQALIMCLLEPPASQTHSPEYLTFPETGDRMAHITLPPGAPGIVGPMLAYPETEKHLNGLAEALLRGPSSLTAAERELIATHVSARNQCQFCMQTHAATARHLFGSDAELVDDVLADHETAPINARLKSLLTIARKVQQGGRRVTEADIAEARKAGADDKAIHDTVLIAAAFCMFNRYVDGLATLTPIDPTEYDRVGAKLAAEGYLNSIRSH
jgi:uncharacterized peroxidase-related enzyme